jgi:hypothetical protein
MNSRTYFIFSWGAYNVATLPQAFIDDHGPFVSGYDEETEQPIHLTTASLFKDAIDIEGIQPSYYAADGSAPEEGDPAFVIVGVPNITEAEERAVYAVADSIAGRTNAVKLSMKQIHHFKTTGELPAAL